MDVFEIIIAMIIGLIVLFILSMIGFIAYGHFKDGASPIETRNIACDQIGKVFNDKYVEKKAGYCYESEFADNFGECPRNDAGIYNAKKTGRYISQTQADDGVWCCVYAKKGNNCNKGTDIGSESPKSKSPSTTYTPSTDNGLSLSSLTFSKNYNAVSHNKNKLIKSSSFTYDGAVFYFGVIGSNDGVSRAVIVTKSNNVDNVIAYITNDKVEITKGAYLINQTVSNVMNIINNKYVVNGNAQFYNTLQEAKANIHSSGVPN